MEMLLQIGVILGLFLLFPIALFVFLFFILLWGKCLFWCFDQFEKTQMYKWMMEDEEY